jgi:ankyrin repeat protein
MILMMAMTLLLADAETFINAIRARDAAAVRTMLDADASLAASRSAKGTSAVTAALFINEGEGFIDPPKNEILRAVLSRNPKLDLFDTAALGTAQQLEAMLGADGVSKRSHFGWTPLHLAAFSGNVANTELLIRKGADVSARAKSKFLNTPLQTAMLTGQYATAKILIEHGADVLVRQSKGFTPLHEAALLGRRDLVDLLLDHGAEINSMSDSGMTPLAEAIRGKHDDLVAYMKSRGGVTTPVPDVE